MVQEFYGDGWGAKYAPSRFLSREDAAEAVSWARKSGTESGYDDAPWAWEKEMEDADGAGA